MTNQLRSGAILTYVAIIINIIVGLVYTPFMLRTLGQSEYGLYSLANSVIAYLTVLDLGFGNAIIRYTAKYRAENKNKEQQEMFGMFLVLYSIIGFIAFIVGSFLAINAGEFFSQTMTTDEVNKARVMLWLMTFNLAFTFPMSIWGSIITAYERFIFLRLVSIIRGVLNPLVMVLLLVVGYKAIAMVIVTTVFNVVTLIINYFYCKGKLSIKVKYGKFDFLLLKDIFIYSFWIFLNLLTENFYWNAGQLVLGSTRGTGDVAVYSVAIHLKDMFYMFSTAISTVLLPKITGMVTKGATNKEISEIFIRTGRIQYIIISLILVGFVLVGKPFVKLWAGDDYYMAYYISLLLFMVTSIPLIQNTGITILQAKNQMRFRCLMIFAVSLISVIVAIPVSKQHGMMGYTIVTATAIFIGYFIILNIYYQKKVGLDIALFWTNIIKMSIPSFIIIVMGYIVFSYIAIESWVGLFIACFLIGILYFILSMFLSFNEYEKNLFMTPINKIRYRLK